MSTIFSVAQDYLLQKQKVAELKRKINKGGFSNDELEDAVDELTELKQKIVAYLNKTEPVIKKVAMIYESNGLEFEAGRLYINGNLPRKPIDYDEEECFRIANFCVENINSAIKAAVSGSFGTEDIKKLCICHFTIKRIARDIDNFKSKIINEYNTKMNKDKYESSKSLYEAEQKVLSLEKQLNVLARNYKTASEDAIYENKIFLGYRNADCSDEVKRLLKTSFGFQDSDFYKEPILLGLGKGEKNIAFFENIDDSFRNYLEALYFKNAINFNSKLRITRIDDNNGYPASLPLFENVKDDSDKKSAIRNVIIDLNSSNPDDNNLFKELFQYRNNRIEHIEMYNKEHDLSLKDYYLVFIDNFPGCLNDEYKINDFVRVINDSARMGFMFIINGKYSENITFKDFVGNDKAIDISRDFSINDGKVELLDYSADKYSFDSIDEKEIKQYKRKIFSYNRKLDTFLLKEKQGYLDSLLDQNAEYKGYNIGEGIDIPVAFTEEGKLYTFSTDTSKNPFAVLTGTTGSGKTAFLHTLILCGALKYSPDELQFYIADFKDKQGSADFEQYTYKEGIRNMYIPHVKYLSTKSSRESAFDMLDLVNKCASENLRQIKDAGFKDFATYNSSDKVKSGKLPKLAQKYFIIDEYATMVNGGGGDESNAGDTKRILDTLADILRRIRTSGVGIILSGQNADILPQETFKFFKNQIAFDLALPDPDEILTALNVSSQEVSHNEAKRFYRYITNRQGFAVSRRLNAIHCIHGIYCGDIGSEDINKITDLIRKRCGNKYSTKQIVPGADSLEPANSFLVESIALKENRNLVISTGSDDLFVENEYNMGLKQALYMGVTNTTSVPTALKYYGNKPNYLAVANDRKLARINMNAIISALYETRLDKPIKNINYISVQFTDDPNLTKLAVGDLKAFANKYKFLKERLNIIEDPNESFEKIIELYKILYERKTAGIKKKASVDKNTPYFLFINKLDWMFDEDILTELNNNDEEDVPVTNNSKTDSDFDASEYAALLAEEGLDSDEEIAALMGVTAEPIKMKASYQSTDIVKALTTILNEGPNYNIFGVMSISNANVYSNLSTDSFLAHKSLILGSFEMINTGEVREFGESLTSCYIRSESDNSVIRMYDYSQTNANKWWSNLKKLFDGGKK